MVVRPPRKSGRGGSLGGWVYDRGDGQRQACMHGIFSLVDDDGKVKAVSLYLGLMPENKWALYPSSRSPSLPPSVLSPHYQTYLITWSRYARGPRMAISWRIGAVRLH